MAHFSVEIPLATAGFDLPDATLEQAIAKAIELLRQAHLNRERRGAKPHKLRAIVSELTPTTRREFWRFVDAPIDPEARERAAKGDDDGSFYWTHVRARVTLTDRHSEPHIAVCGEQR